MAGYRAVTPEYLSTLGRAAPSADVLDRATIATARRASSSSTSRWRGSIFPDAIRSASASSSAPSLDPDFPTMEIVGVVGDMKQSFEAGSKAELFVPYAQYPDPILAGMYLNTALVVRTAGDPAASRRRCARRCARSIPSQPLVNVAHHGDGDGGHASRSRGCR